MSQVDIPAEERGRHRLPRGQLTEFLRREYRGAREDPAGAFLMFFTCVGLGLLAAIIARR